MHTSDDAHDNCMDLSGTRILVVEDEFLLAELISDALSEAGACVLGPACTEEKAMALIETEELDLALLDSNIRGRSIYPVAEALQRKGTCFAFLSGYSNLKHLSAKFPDAPVFEKPVRFDTLQTALRTLLQPRVAADRPREGRLTAP